MARSTLLFGPQRRFCEGIVRGLRSQDAYQAAYPNASFISASVHASPLLRKPHIAAEIRRQRELAAATAGPSVLTPFEKRLFLARIVRVHFDHILQDPERYGDLVRSLIPGPPHRGPRILLPDRLAAIRLDNELSGHGILFRSDLSDPPPEINFGFHDPRRPHEVPSLLRTCVLPAALNASLPSSITASRPPLLPPGSGQTTAGNPPAPAAPAILPKPWYHLFCRLIADGCNIKTAYLQSRPSRPRGNVCGYAGELSRRPYIRAEIQRLRDLAEAAPDSPVMTLLAKRQFLARIVRLNVFRICPHRDADLIKRIRPTAFGPRYILYCKLAAIRLDNHLAGHRITTRFSAFAHSRS